MNISKQLATTTLGHKPELLKKGKEKKTILFKNGATNSYIKI